MPGMGGCNAVLVGLTLKAPITTGRRHFQSIFFLYFSEEILLDITRESSAQQTIHM